MKKDKIIKLKEQSKLLKNSGINIYNNVDYISVDIQPEYEDGFNFNLSNYLNFLNENVGNFNRLIFLYNGQDTLGMISKSEYINWLYDNGLYEEVIEKINFFDKGYAFFRYCIDSNIDEDEIVDLVKFMQKNDINDSRDINDDMWLQFIKEYPNNKDIKNLMEYADDMINIPELMDFLKQFSNIVLCGGGINECLKEVEIALLALNKNYKLNHDFIY